jgi:hypothetical protein
MQGNRSRRRSAFNGVLCVALAAASGVWVPMAAHANGTHTGHQFAVTEGGAATLTIPIQVPRGIGGLEPQLSLNYSSGAGNGLLGVGWTLSGPSAITRCGKTLPLDNERGAVTFTGADRFCLDGQRLVSNTATTDSNYGNAGTVYWTERESFSRITAVGTYAAGVPAGFKVETKSGLIMEFGAITGFTGDAQALTNPVSGGTTTINRWLLKRISDRMPVANTVEFYYCAREVVGSTCATTGTYTGSNVLHYIRYTNRGSTPGTNAVVFGYESRDDRLIKFQAGASQTQTQRMVSITTYLGFASPTSLGEPVKRYELTYEPLKDSAGLWTRATNVSRLSRVQELAGAAAPTTPAFAARAAADALPPLDFTYAADRVYGKALPQTTSGGTATSPAPVEQCGGYAGANRTKQLCK